MRPLKFRAWDSRGKKMHFADFLDDDFESFPGLGGDAQYIIMQFTGLTDKNGKDVYEGDILEIGGELFEVSYLGHAFEIFPLTDNAAKIHGDVDEEWTSGTLDDKCMGVEVIGDIYSNPELL